MRPWNTMRATGYGGLIGLTAAAFKSLAPSSASRDRERASGGDTCLCTLVRRRRGAAQFRRAPPPWVGNRTALIACLVNMGGDVERERRGVGDVEAFDRAWKIEPGQMV